MAGSEPEEKAAPHEARVDPRKAIAEAERLAADTERMRGPLGPADGPDLARVIAATARHVRR